MSATNRPSPVVVSMDMKAIEQRVFETLAQKRQPIRINEYLRNVMAAEGDH
jgi:hypothetical protein